MAKIISLILIIFNTTIFTLFSTVWYDGEQTTEIGVIIMGALIIIGIIINIFSELFDENYFGK